MPRAMAVTLCVAAAIAGGVAAGPAHAFQADRSSSRVLDRNLLIQPVRGCHRAAERHYVPEFRRRAWHIHRGADCTPVEVEEPGPADCHRDIRRHFVPEIGATLTHRHVGPGCELKIYRPFQPGLPKPEFCIQIGALRYCDY